MGSEPSGSGDEPLEEFYGDAGEVARLAGAGSDAGDDASAERFGVAGAVPAGGSIRRMPVAGSLMAGIALGLRDVFDPVRRDEVVIEQPAPEQPLEPQRYELHLDAVTPEDSYAVYRPWVDGLEGEQAPDSGQAGDPGEGPVKSELLRPARHPKRPEGPGKPSASGGIGAAGLGA